MTDFDPDNVAETLNIGSIVHGDPDPAAVIVPCPVQSNNDDIHPREESTCTPE